MSRALPAITPRAGQSHAAALVQKAEQKLWQREHAAVQNDEGMEAKKERVTVVLKSAMEIVTEEGSDDSIAELERAVEAAQLAGVLPQLRVQARKLLADQQSDRKKRQRLEEQLAKLVKQTEAAHEARIKGVEAEKGKSSESSPTMSSPERIRTLATQKKKCTMALQLLRQANEAAKRQHLSEDLIIHAHSLIQAIEHDLNNEEQQEFKLKQLLNLDDPEKLEARLQLARNLDEAKGPKVAKVVDKLEARLSKLLQHEQQQTWLDSEIEKARDAHDSYRLRQLISQGRILNLVVAPAVMTHLHALDEGLVPSSHNGASSPVSPGALEDKRTPRDAMVVQKTPREGQASGRKEVTEARLGAFMDRKKQAMDKLLKYVENDPTLSKFNEAKQAISDAKATKVPVEITIEMDKRLIALEESHGPRLHAEENLMQILRSAELVTFDKVEGGEDNPVLQDMSKIAVLRDAVVKARKTEISQDLLHAGEALLDRSIAFEVQQRSAGEHLREVLKNPLQDDKKLEELHLAIDTASRCGISTLHAERELLKLREIQVHREAAEAELREARKGQGAVGKARLEAAIQTAKSAGVSAQKLRAANSRREQLDEHHQKCTLVAGNIRRRLPTLDQEPWRFQQIVQNAQSLQPWTPELERLVRQATEQLDHSITAQTSKREVDTELQTLLKRIAADHASGQTNPEDATHLEEVLPRARTTKVSKELLQEGEVQLRALKRSECQRTVAEHRLRLALNAKDFGEIERSLREVRSLAGGLIENKSSPKGDQSHQPQSARLMDSANVMLRHLGDQSTRKQAAETALMQRIAESDGAPLPMVAGAESQAGTSTGTTIALHGSDGWVKEVMDIVHEAKQSGVAPSLIEHAKLKIRQKRRERREEVQAVAALKKTLLKKNASTQELLMNMRKVERFHAKPADSNPEDATTQP